MKRLLYFFLSLCMCCLTPCSWASSLNEAQEKVLEQQLAPIRAVLDDLMTTVDLLMKVRLGERTAEEITPEVRRLLEQVADNRKQFEEQPVAEDEEVARIVSLWMRWNHEKLATATNILIQMGNQYVNTPGSPAALVDGFRHSFFAKDLHVLADYPAAELAKAESSVKLIKEFSSGMEECLKLLKSISDKAGADAAAPRVKELLAQYALYYQQFLSLSPESDVQNEILSTTAYVFSIPTLLMELNDAVHEMAFRKQCYESEALKEVLEAF